MSTKMTGRAWNPGGFGWTENPGDRPFFRWNSKIVRI